MDGDVYSNSWLPTKSMLADMMTKEMQLKSSLEKVILKNIMYLSQPLVNEVRAMGTEIRMTNIRNRWVFWPKLTLNNSWIPNDFVVGEPIAMESYMIKMY